MNHSAKVAWLLNEESNSISLGPGPCYTHLVLTFELGNCSWVIGNVYFELDYWRAINYLYEALFMCIYKFTLRYTHRIPGFAAASKRGKEPEQWTQMSDWVPVFIHHLIVWANWPHLQIHTGLELNWEKKIIISMEIYDLLETWIWWDCD